MLKWTLAERKECSKLKEPPTAASFDARIWGFLHSPPLSKLPPSFFQQRSTHLLQSRHPRPFAQITNLIGLDCHDNSTSSILSPSTRHATSPYRHGQLLQRRHQASNQSPNDDTLSPETLLSCQFLPPYFRLQHPRSLPPRRPRQRSKCHPRALPSTSCCTTPSTP